MTTGTSGEQGFIPNFFNDTLVNLNGGLIRDSFFTIKSGDTSIIKYHGEKLYIFWRQNLSLVMTDSSQAWGNCYISPVPFDTTAAYSRCYLSSGRYWDQSRNRWDSTYQTIIISQLYPHFDTSVDGWFISKRFRE